MCTTCKCAQQTKSIHVHTFNPTSPMEPLSPRLPTAPANPYKIYPHKSTIRMQNYTYRNARKSPSASSTYWPRRPIRTLQEEKINSSKYFLFIFNNSTGSPVRPGIPTTVPFGPRSPGRPCEEMLNNVYESTCIYYNMHILITSQSSVNITIPMALDLLWAQVGQVSLANRQHPKCVQCKANQVMGIKEHIEGLTLGPWSPCSPGRPTLP